MQIHNPITRYQRDVTTDANGTFRFTNVPPNVYHVEIIVPGFSTYAQDVTLRGSVPISVKAQLELATAETSSHAYPLRVVTRTGRGSATE